MHRTDHTKWELDSKSLVNRLMTSIICLTATVLAILTIPLIILLRITETKQQTAKRLRAGGKTYKVIAQITGVSATTARKYALA